MSYRQHGYPLPSLATSPNHSSLLAGLQGYIPYSHIAAECMIELVILLLLGHMWGSIMSSSLLLQQCPACLVRLTCIVFMMGGRWPYSWCLVGCCAIYIYIYISEKLVTIVKGKPKAPFSIATVLRCWRGSNSFPWIAPLYPWSILYDAEC